MNRMNSLAAIQRMIPYNREVEGGCSIVRTIFQKRRLFPALLAVVIASLLATSPAHAFRCGSRIVQEGMHESEVVRLCGEPVSTAHLGYVIRAVHYGGSLTRRHDRNYGYYRQEIPVTEMIFNFGPRKLMRKLRFEGGVLRSIRTMGYGYIEKND